MTTDSDLIARFLATHDVVVPVGARTMSGREMRAAIRCDPKLDPSQQITEQNINGVWHGYNAHGELVYTEKE